MKIDDWPLDIAFSKSRDPLRMAKPTSEPMRATADCILVHSVCGDIPALSVAEARQPKASS